MEFQPANNRIQVRTFAPCRNNGAGEYETDASSEFTLSYNMAGAGAYAQIGTPQSVSSGGTATVNWPSLAQSTQYEWYVTVSDGNTTITGPTWAFTTGTGGNHPPTVTQPADQTSAEGQVISLQVAASDLDNDALNYVATGLPAGLTIGASTGLIAGTIGAGAASGSPYHVTVTVSDGMAGGRRRASRGPSSQPCSDHAAATPRWSAAGRWTKGAGRPRPTAARSRPTTVTFVGTPTWTSRPKWRGDQPQRHEPVRRHAGRGQPGHRQPDHPGGLGQARDHLRHAARPD